MTLLRSLIQRRRIAKRTTQEQRETVSHAQMLEHLGYIPEQARIRIRRAQPPKVSET